MISSEHDVPAGARAARMRAIVLDVACVAAFVVAGTRNHDTDTGPGAVVMVAAPFLIALCGAHLVPIVRNAPLSTRAALVVWSCTLVGGMVLRRAVFDRGTASAFVVVAAVSLFVTIAGWRRVIRPKAASATSR